MRRTCLVTRLSSLRIGCARPRLPKFTNQMHFVLGTVDEAHHPRTRTVLLKGVDERGFFFATNYLSRKGEAVAANNNVSATFGWYSMYRQVLIQGIAEKAVAAESDEYHASRPHDSQVAAWSSQQSQPIDTRTALDAQYDQALAKFQNSDVPRPDYWGMYRIIPTRIEFWKGRTNRMHDRIEFVRNVTADGVASEWKVQRLQP